MQSPTLVQKTRNLTSSLLGQTSLSLFLSVFDSLHCCGLRLISVLRLVLFIWVPCVLHIHQIIRLNIYVSTLCQGARSFVEQASHNTSWRNIMLRSRQWAWYDLYWDSIIFKRDSNSNCSLYPSDHVLKRNGFLDFTWVQPTVEIFTVSSIKWYTTPRHLSIHLSTFINSFINFTLKKRLSSWEKGPS